MPRGKRGMTKSGMRPTRGKTRIRTPMYTRIKKR
jgi:hypothetical protein